VCGQFVDRIDRESKNKLAEILSMGLADFERHLSDPSPAFWCYACGDHAEKPTLLARLQNRVGLPAKPRTVASIEKRLGRAANQIKQFYAKHDGVLMYEDMHLSPGVPEEERTAGIYFFPVAQWNAMSREMRSSLKAMGWSRKEMTDWLLRGIAFAELPMSANFFVIQPQDKAAGKIYYAAHDSFVADPIAGCFNEFLDKIVRNPPRFLNRLGCYARYSDGKSDTQWIPTKYVPNGIS
jgi:hypothetical protein